MQLAKIPHFMGIVWDPWIKKRDNYLSCIEVNGVLTFTVLHKMPRYLLNYYKISFTLSVSCLVVIYINQYFNFKVIEIILILQKKIVQRFTFYFKELKIEIDIKRKITSHLIWRLKKISRAFDFFCFWYI